MKAALSVMLLVLALGGAGALAVWGLQAQEGASAAYHVSAIGPAGPLLDERVEVENATALGALQAAAARAGLAIVIEEYPMGTYVRAIDGHRAAGASGWIYEVERAGAWVSGDRSAAYFPLQKGDALRWSWTSA